MRIRDHEQRNLTVLVNTKMKSANMLLFSAVLIGLLSLSHQQENNAPTFVGVSDLTDILTTQGILESTDIGTSLARLSCTDEDGTITTYGVTSQTLVVNSVTGVVRLNRNLDRENYINRNNTAIIKPVFYCTDDSSLTAFVEVDITITDVNDNAPEFLGKPYRKEVPENTPNGTEIFNGVFIYDADNGDNARVDVTCLRNPIDPETLIACDTFSVLTRGTGFGRFQSSIFLKGKLDFETRQSYTMTLFAVDQSKDPLNPPLNSTVNVQITVLDTQDTNPVFLNIPLTIYVNENVAVGTPLNLSISARDGDVGDPREVRIRMKNDPQSLFRLGDSTPTRADPGVYSSSVYVNAPLDREKLLGTYEFEVEAVEYENGTATTAVTSSNVRVDILDENDNVPTFSQTVYNVSLYEIDANGQSNFQIPDLNIQITDRDNPSNAVYQVVIASQTWDTFTVFPQDNVTGNVAVNLLVINATLLDYDEERFRRQVVYLEARELATNSPRTSTAVVNILLLDLNDNSPIFVEPTYTFQHPENASIGTTIGVIQATDKDDDQNGRVSYALGGKGSELFFINSTTGVITLVGQLDYEQNPVISILMIARDAGSPSREISRTLTIQVTNVNDEPPTPLRSIYQTYAQETSLELRPSVTVEATDNEDPNSVITYAIIAGNTPDGAFVVDRLGGQLTLTKYLDFDATPNRQGFFEVVIQVSDNGNPPQYANITVKVNVQDENNNDPVFVRPNYYASIRELDPPGTSVVVVSASDLDKEANGRIRYTISSGAREHFQISESNGFISVSDKARFDFEDFPEYRMVVYAIDSGSPPRTGTTTVVVDIQDANNKPPVFTQQIYVISISEATPLRTTVLTVTASDLDSSASLRYSIPPGSVQPRNSDGIVISSENGFDYRNAFVVAPTSGVISTNRTLSRELAAEISFNVVVEDLNAENGGQSATASILITVLGTNVSTIYFTPARYFFSVTEGKRKGYVITTVAARDPACGNCLVNNYVEVRGTDPLGYLEVDRQTGRVSLSQAIDYDEVRSRRLYMEIEAIASDGRTALTNLVVDVRDDNDNSPVFRQDAYSFIVSESLRYPYRVGFVKATDKDSGSFGKIQYSISGQGSSDFQIFDSGLILVSQTANLDYERTKVYNLLVTASDNPTNQTSTVRRQTSVPLTITVRDVNDNRPQFSPIYPFYVVENFYIGQSVGRIIATDADEGINGEIVFSMDDTSGLFRITETGYILTQRSLRDMSPLSPFIVTVRAQDRGIPSLYNETKVEINIRSGQLDDGRPQWSIPRLGVTYFVDENVPEVQFVVQARAFARSSGPEVYYSFNTESDDHLMFNVDRITGNITTNGIFDRETQAVYDLILVATDRYNESLQSYRGLTVRVRDKDDNVPDFGKCPGVSLEVPQTVSILENTPVDTFVYRVRACDIDEIDSDQVFYQEEQDNELCVREMAGGFFKVSIDGNITTNRPLDRESKPYHLFCVRASSRPGRQKRQADGFNRAEMTDTGRIAYVVITLLDINDNRPMFVNKILYEAVASVPTKNTVVQVVANDRDLLPFNRVLYSIQSIDYREPGYPAYPLPGSFVIGPDTGIVSVNFPSYSDFRIPNSFFNVTIQAEDFLNSDFKDYMNLYVYIIEPSQILRVVIDKSPDEARGLVDDLIRDLSIADPTSLFKLQQVSYHRVIDEFDVTRTDVCFVMVNNDRVLSIREGGNTLSQTKLDEVLNRYGARSPGSCYRTRSSLDRIDWAPLWWTLVALAIFIFICCCILIAAVYILHRNYKNYMSTRKTYLVQQ